MAFQKYAPIQIVVCPNCSGEGCADCNKFGVYALNGDRNLTFSLPPYLEIAKRKKAKIILLVKRGVVIVLAFFVISLLWSLVAKL